MRQGKNTHVSKHVCLSPVPIVVLRLRFESCVIVLVGRGLYFVLGVWPQRASTSLSLFIACIFVFVLCPSCLPPSWNSTFLLVLLAVPFVLFAFTSYKLKMFLRINVLQCLLNCFYGERGIAQN